MFQIAALYEQPADAAAFDSHYDNIHLGLARKVPGIKRYTVLRPAADLAGNPSTYYQIAVIEFASLEACQAALSTPEGQALQADVANLSRCTIVVGPGTSAFD